MKVYSEDNKFLGKYRSWDEVKELIKERKLEALKVIENGKVWWLVNIWGDSDEKV